jgi:hypothetical protein
MIRENIHEGVIYTLDSYFEDAEAKVEGIRRLEEKL